MVNPNPEEEPVIINDKRRINTENQETQSLETPEPSVDDLITESIEEEVEETTEEKDNHVADLTNTLQRLQAEFQNFKKRTERERFSLAESANSLVFSELIPVLDDIDLAKQHGDLENGPLKTVSDKLQQLLAKYKVERFGEVGDKFDPNLHEAIQNSGTSDNLVLETVMRVGYRIGDKILRTAMVIVTDASE